jgi:calcineurin-like phosphoesterase family protein
LSNIFVVSDTHFCHENIIGYCGRPFHDVHHMDEMMVQNWNKVVSQNDKVYHLGDVYLSKAPRAKELLKRLNGTKVLILGNHDNGRDQLLHAIFTRIYAYRFLPDTKLFLSHVPSHVGSIKEGFINVHGHIHNNPSPPGPYFNACVEHHNYAPINIERIKV